MKRVVFGTLIMFIFLSTQGVKLTAFESSEEPVIFIEHYNYERLYDEDQNLIREKVLDDNEYTERVQKVQNVRNARATKRIIDNVPSDRIPSRNPSIHQVFDVSNDNLDLEQSITTSDLPSLEPIDGGGGSDSTDYCSVYVHLCYDEEVYDAEYTTHTTEVLVYPNNTAPYDSIMKVNSTLSWDIMPSYRMVDVMTVSYDGLEFDVLNDTIEADMVADQYYYRYERGEGSTEYNDEKYKPFDLYDEEIKAYSNGVIFNADISQYKDIDYSIYNNYVPGMLEIRQIETYTNLTINLSMDLTLKNGTTVRDSSLNSTRLKAQYTHFWEELSLNPSLNAGIGFSGPSTGISIDAEKYTKHDGSRTNYFQFLFSR